jgi:predicted S18 family serine protease
MRRLKPLYLVFVLLMALNLAQAALNQQLLEDLTSARELAEELAAQIQEAAAGYSLLVKEVGRLREELREKEKTLEAERRTVSLGNRKAIYVLGVTDSQGIALKLLVEKNPGGGRVLVDIKHAILETDLQGAALNSLAAAENLLGEKIVDDIVFTVDNPLNSSIVLTGESAGAAMAVAIVALEEGREIRENVVITGGVTRSGKILVVSQLGTKAAAARAAGADTLLVPRGQGRDLGVPGLRVVEVGTLEEAVERILY